jgi:hypothetical protein
MVAESAVKESGSRCEVNAPSRAVWAMMSPGKSSMIASHRAKIVQYAGVADVTSAARFTRSHNVVVAVPVTGYDVARISPCDGGMIIDLSAMKDVSVGPLAHIARLMNCGFTVSPLLVASLGVLYPRRRKFAIAAVLRAICSPPIPSPPIRVHIDQGTTAALVQHHDFGRSSYCKEKGIPPCDLL